MVHILIIASIVFWCITLTIKYLSFGYYDWDLAICSNTMWNLSHGSMHNSLLQLDNFLGNHVNLIAFLLVPLYRIIPHPLLLIYLQTLSLLLSAWVVYVIARREIGPKIGLLILMGYLFYPALWHGLLYEFHFLSLSVIFLSLAFLYFYKNYFLRFILFSLLALLCREDVSLVVVGLGIYAAFTKRGLKWRVTPLLLGLLWGYISVFIIGAHFAKNNQYGYAFLLDHLGDKPSGAVKNILFNPALVLRILFAQLRINTQYVIDLFTPVGFLPFFNARTIILLPLMMLNLLSSNLSQHRIYHHYTLPLIPFIFIVTIYGIKYLKEKGVHIIKVLLLISGLLFSFYRLPYGKVIHIFKGLKAESLPQRKESLLSYIPKDAAVIASFKFMPALSNRKILYSIHKVLLDNERTGTVDYAIVDFNESFLINSYYKNESSKFIRDLLIRNKLSLVRSINDMVLLKKDYDSSLKLYETGPYPDYATKLYLSVNNEINLLGYSFFSSRVKPGQIIEVNFYWQKINETNQEYEIVFMLRDDKGKVVYEINHPICYHIYPTKEWRRDEVIKETYRWLIPQVRSGAYSLDIIFFDTFTKRIASLQAQDNDIISDEVIANLAKLEITD